VPLTSVSVPPTGSTTQEVAARKLKELSGLVYEYGKCRTHVFEPGEDPWFPVSAVPSELEELAVKACVGCPVIAECLEMTLQLEAGLARDKIVGIFGATPGHRRLQMLDERRGGETR
jgi:Transcription factor WhiB